MVPAWRKEQSRLRTDGTELLIGMKSNWWFLAVVSLQNGLPTFYLTLFYRELQKFGMEFIGAFRADWPISSNGAQTNRSQPGTYLAIDSTCKVLHPQARCSRYRLRAMNEIHIEQRTIQHQLAPRDVFWIDKFHCTGAFFSAPFMYNYKSRECLLSRGAFTADSRYTTHDRSAFLASISLEPGFHAIEGQECRPLYFKL
ncbi:hypothetical protein F5B17DRAFT_242924 [Nemania serpens]|nr:hypothetical protein F5B17DRAFT_242924 [Nemania serpens]